MRCQRGGGEWARGRGTHLPGHAAGADVDAIVCELRRHAPRHHHHQLLPLPLPPPPRSLQLLLRLRQVRGGAPQSVYQQHHVDVRAHSGSVRQCGEREQVSSDLALSHAATARPRPRSSPPPPIIDIFHAFICACVLKYILVQSTRFTLARKTSLVRPASHSTCLPATSRTLTPGSPPWQPPSSSSWAHAGVAQ